MSKDPNFQNEDSQTEPEPNDYKYAEPSQSIQHTNYIHEEDEINITTNELLDDIDHSNITQNIYNKNKIKTHRKKSKSSTNLLQQLRNAKKNHYPSSNNKQTNDIRRRRHSESSSESHSSKDYQQHQHKHKQNPVPHLHKKSNSNHNKMPIHHIPLSHAKNHKNVKKRSFRDNNDDNSQQKKSNSNPQSPRSRKSFTRSILSRYKSSTTDKKNDNKKPLGISGPINVQHVIHVEWDQQRNAFQGIPDIWHSKIPQSYTVPTQELQMGFNKRDNRSVSLTQQIISKTKHNKSILPQSHQTISRQSSKSYVNDEKTNHHHYTNTNSPIDYTEIDDIADPLAMPLPGPRVFIGQRHNKSEYNEISSDISSQIPDFHGLLSNQVMSIKEYLDRIGIDDLNKKMSVSMIRRMFFIKMGFSKRDPLISSVPRHIQQQILTYLDIKSYLRCCTSCSDLASFLDDPIIWKIQVLYKSKVQGTLHKTNFRLRHRAWKQMFMSMVKVDQNTKYYDYVWNIVVCGDTKSGQDRLVVSLGKHWRCKLTYLEPVISAVNGTYRFGVDFVIRRVIIHNKIIKLQVWDNNNIMADVALLKSVNIFLILFDTTKKDSFDKTLHIARSMMSLLQNMTMSDNVQLIMVGNITNNPKNRIVSYESAKRFANERGLMYIEANTDNPDSINDAFVNLAEECIHYQHLNKSGNKKESSSNCIIQ